MTMKLINTSNKIIAVCLCRCTSITKKQLTWMIILSVIISTTVKTRWKQK